MGRALIASMPPALAISGHVLGGARPTRPSATRIAGTDLAVVERAGLLSPADGGVDGVPAWTQRPARPPPHPRRHGVAMARKADRRMNDRRRH